MKCRGPFPFPRNLAVYVEDQDTLQRGSERFQDSDRLQPLKFGFVPEDAASRHIRWENCAVYDLQRI
jgi:hypothetical protein